MLTVLLPGKLNHTVLQFHRRRYYLVARQIDFASNVSVGVRAKVWDDKGIAPVTMPVDGGTAQSMTCIGSTQMWSTPYKFSSISSGDHRIRVNVRGAAAILPTTRSSFP